MVTIVWVHAFCTACMLPLCAPFTIRRVCARFVESSARYIMNGMQKFGAIGFEVVRVGDAFTNAVDAHCVHCVMNVRVRSM